MDETANIPYILIVGGANTGRSPMAAALLRRILAKRHISWVIESAGVLGHDDDPAELEARSAMHAIDLDITAHIARSLTQEIVQTATILLAIDQGIVHVLRSQYPTAIDKTLTLGNLAGRKRDIPDPYRMQVATWISYAKEIETLLFEGVDQLIQLVQQWTSEATTTQDPPVASGDEPQSGDNGDDQAETLSPPEPMPEDIPGTIDEAQASPPSAAAEVTVTLAEEHQQTRTAQLERCIRLMQVIRDMPTLISWEQARAEMETALTIIEKLALHTGDLIYSYVNLYTALLGMQPQTPNPTQADHLLACLETMHHPIEQYQVTELSSLVVRWSQEGLH
jgi:protein-tyrosine-phosphatase